MSRENGFLGQKSTAENGVARCLNRLIHLNVDARIAASLLCIAVMRTCVCTRLIDRSCKSCVQGRLRNNSPLSWSILEDGYLFLLNASIAVQTSMGNVPKLTFVVRLCGQLMISKILIIDNINYLKRTYPESTVHST